MASGFMSLTPDHGAAPGKEQCASSQANELDNHKRYLAMGSIAG